MVAIVACEEEIYFDFSLFAHVELALHFIIQGLFSTTIIEDSFQFQPNVLTYTPEKKR